MRARVPPVSAATPVWSWPGKSGKPDSKLPIFSVRPRVGCLFYIFISTTEGLQSWSECRGVGGPAVNATSRLCPNAGSGQDFLVLMGGCLWPHNPALLLGTVSSRLWPQLTQSLPKCHLQMSKSQQSAPLRTDGGQQIRTSTRAPWRRRLSPSDKLERPVEHRAGRTAFSIRRVLCVKSGDRRLRKGG